MAAPVHCIECGKPAYIPFGENPCCTNKECRYYDKETGELYKRLNNAKVEKIMDDMPTPYILAPKDEVDD